MVVSLNCLSHTNTQHDSQTRTGVDSGQEGSGKTYEEALLLLLSWRHISLYKVTIHPVSIVKKKGRSNEKQLYVPSLTCSIYVQYTNARVCVCVCVRVRSLSGEGYNVLFLCPCFFFSGCVMVGMYFGEPHRNYIRAFRYSVQDVPLRSSAVHGVVQQQHESLKHQLTQCIWTWITFR